MNPPARSAGTPTPRFDVDEPLPSLRELGRVHLIAIGGAGMSAVARLLLARGVPVSGSDAQPSATLVALADLGARVHVGHDPAHLVGADTVVVSSAIREDNAELVAARRAGLRVLHRSQALAAVIGGRRCVAVAGANGKTTTTSMLVAALDAAGLDTSFASGGEISARATNAHWGDDDAFVVEADESDGSFLVYRPEVAVVTNVQPDHLDFYGTFERVQQAYAAFAASMAAGGLLVACADDSGSLALAEQVGEHERSQNRPRRRVLTYGTSSGADVRLGDWSADRLGSHAVLVDADGVERTLVMNTPGEHNALNALAAYTAAVHGFGADPSAVLSGLAAFAGARRRFEVVGVPGGVMVVDDYAHNAGKVSAVVATAARIAAADGGRLTVLFQPHLYSRTRDFAQGFAAGLAPADRVCVLDVYGAREEPVPGVGSSLITDPLARLPGRRDVATALSGEELLAWAIKGARPGDLLLVVGAGDVTQLAPLIVQRLVEGQRAGR